MQFYHPSGKKLFNILLRDRPEDIDEDTRKMLSEIEQSCKKCVEVKRRLYGSSVSVPENYIVFNRELLIDVFFTYGRPVLSMVHKHTNFISSVFLKNESGKETLSLLLLPWLNALSGYADIIRNDHAQVFQSASFRACSRNRGRLPLVEDLSTTVRGSPEPFASQRMTLSMTWIPHYFWFRNLGDICR